MAGEFEESLSNFLAIRSGKEYALHMNRFRIAYTNRNGQRVATSAASFQLAQAKVKSLRAAGNTKVSLKDPVRINRHYVVR